ncbi:MAG TPA: alpha/beta fold hydrolase [Sphingomonas sp.]
MAREVRFENRAGVSLAGSLELPPGRVRAVALFAHCFTCTQASHGARRVTNALAAHGIATLRFDFTGLGKSGGDFADSHFGANVDDLVAAAAHLEQTIGAPSILIGHSLGGAAVIAAAARVPAARAVVTIGAPFDPAHALHHISAEDAARIEAEGVGTVAIGGRPFRVSRDFLDAAKGQDQATRLAHLKKALLVLHAPTDVVVGIDNAKAIYEAARHPKSFVALDGADHLLTDAACAAYAASIIAAWVEPFLLPAQEPDALPEGCVRVGSGEGAFVQMIDASGHTFLADEPARSGGSDLGPTPYDLLLAALGACTAMTIELIARAEGIPVDGVEVILRHERRHADDCAAAASGRPYLEVLHREIRLGGNLTLQQRDRMLVIANKCPVHRTLESGPRVETVLVD